MPHRCTECSYVIPDESEDLFNGCNECGNQSWEYLKRSSDDSDDTTEDNSQREARTEFVSSDDLPDSELIEGLQNPTAGQNNEDTSANNSDHVKVDEIDELREKLNSQYEGIEVHRKGHYKINLTELYRGQDYIIEIGEDGAYHVTQAKDLDT